MSWEKILDHVQQAKDRLLEQYKGKAGVEGLISAWAGGIQALEDLFNDLADEDVDSATGQQLDLFGEVVGLDRVAGQTDEDYRFEIKIKVVQNFIKGTPEEIIAAVGHYLGVDLFDYVEVYPAQVDIFSIDELDPFVAEKFYFKIKSFLPAGVALGNFGFAPYDEILRFDVGYGLGDEGVLDDGDKFAGLYYFENNLLLKEDGGSFLTEGGKTILME